MPSTEVTPAQALQLLIEGNQRFASDASTHLNRSQERRQELKEKQEPFAVVLSCSDSRVASEIIFDQGLGDLFVVRIAGNVVGPLELNSIQYAALHLHSSLILVLGHENCGAVNAAINGEIGDIPAISKLLIPAVKKTKNQGKDRLENTVKENVRLVVEQLNKSAGLKELVQKNKLSIVGGYYRLQDGRVELLQ